jgi:beta-xylosidase
LYNWKDEGIALAVSDDPESDIIKGCVLERPKVIFNKKTRRYVMWFHLELKDQGYTAARTGVAVSDKVTGPYKFIESFRPDGQESRDMTVYVDDDEKAYLLHSSENNATLHISLLTDDYLKPAGKFERVFEGRFMEAPVVFKCKGKYYFIASDCTGWAPNAARSAMADKITGPWTELGNPCIGTEEQCSVTFTSQSTYVLPVPNKKDAFIFMADRWRPENAVDGRYIWLPIEFENGRPVIRWVDQWDLGVFNRP